MNLEFAETLTGTKSTIHVMLGVGIPDTSHLNIASVPAFGTRVVGFLAMTGKPAGTVPFTKKKRKKKIKLSYI